MLLLTPVENSRKNSSKLLKKLQLQEKVSSQLMRVQELLERDLNQSELRIIMKTDRPTESFFSLLQELMNSSVASSCLTRQPEIHVRMELSSVTSLDQEEFTAVSRSILDLSQLLELKMRLPLKVLMDLEKDVLNIMLWDADSPSGEPSLRLVMDAHLKLLLLRLPTLLLDMDPSAKRMDSSQLSNQKFYKMENMTLMFVLMFLKESSQL